ncbi:acetyl-CoA synthetase-like protein [Mycena floridula]|nr:acetyl-CoA synthetase-like protein [Mycena floridula]
MDSLLLALDTHSSKPFLKILSSGPSEPPVWTTFTYARFREDMLKAAAFWHKTFTSIGIQANSVIGLWLTGNSYHDLVNMYAMVRAGYIPQMFSLRMDFGMIVDLLAVTKAHALLYDSSLSDKVTEFGLPTFRTDILTEVSDPLPEVRPVERTDKAMIFHTSGTTSGRPKPVPETHAIIMSTGPTWRATCQGEYKTTPTFNNMGSFANPGSAITVYCFAYSGHCLIQTSKPDFDTTELLAMVQEGMNGLQIFAPWLTLLLKTARTDPAVLAALQSLVQITYAGAAMNPEDDRWCLEKNLPISVFYATTETGICLVSDLSNKANLPLMRIINPQTQMIPATNMNKADLDGDSIGRFQGGTLYDLFIPETADHCPHDTVRNRSNGHITGDLFEEVKPGLYAFRGRNDDWIRTGKDLSFCDTKAIEDNVLLICADIVGNCVVVGHYKPAVVLFVEPFDLSFSYETGSKELKRQILERTLEFNKLLYAHERITEESLIVIVKPGVLPRTVEKGNIRRKAVEEEYKDVLDTIYSRIVVKS